MTMEDLSFATEHDKEWFRNLFKASKKQKDPKMPQRLKIKVCGMRDFQNIMDVAQTGIDFMGFIFYPKSKRYVGPDFDSMIPHWVSKPIKTVGVFVDEDAKQLVHTARRYKLAYVQLHGNESPEYCQYAKSEGLRIIKAFGIDENFDFASLEAYLPYVDYFLFDTASAQHGGTGKKFNWAVLDKYALNKPFLLSGGIGPLDAQAILDYEHPMLKGIDINSRFETAPAQKDVQMLEAFNRVLRNKNCMNCGKK